MTERRQAWIGLSKSAQGNFVWDDDAGEITRPRIWGRGEPALVTAETRAVVTLLPLTGGTSSEVDIQLARAIPLSEERPYICQYGPGL